MEQVNSGNQGDGLYTVLDKRIEDHEIYINKSNKDDLWEVVYAIVNNETFGDDSKLNGVMLKGIPGTGKGYTVQWIRTKVSDIIGNDINVFNVSSLESPDEVTALYEKARKEAGENGRCIIWDDEVDKYGKRSDNQNGREAVLNQILIEMQGKDSNDGVITMCCTNRPNMVDPAYRRGKRCGKEITIDPLDLDGRVAVSKIEAYERNHQFIFDDKQIEDVASETFGAVAADITQLFIDVKNYSNLKLQQGLTDVAYDVLFGDGFEEKLDKLVEDNLVGVTGNYIDAVKEAKDGLYDCEIVKSKVKENDPNRERKLSEILGQRIYTILNPNGKKESEDDDFGLDPDAENEKVEEGNESKRWIKINGQQISYVLDKFNPSALKDMPFEETKTKFSYFGARENQEAFIRRLVDNTIAQDKKGSPVLFYGEQGQGVTEFARAVAGEYGFNLIVTYGADQESKYVAVVKDRLLEIYDRASASKPTIWVLDNVHYLAQNTQGGDHMYKQAASSALSQVLKPTVGLIQIGTVEQLAQLDNTTKNYFKSHINFECPKYPDDYMKIWQSNIDMENVKKGENIDFDVLGPLSKTMSGGNIHDICRTYVDLGIEYTQDSLVKVVNHFSGDRKENMGSYEIANLVMK